MPKKRLTVKLPVNRPPVEIYSHFIVFKDRFLEQSCKLSAIDESRKEGEQYLHSSRK
jgi:hypothetical protein